MHRLLFVALAALLFAAAPAVGAESANMPEFNLPAATDGKKVASDFFRGQVLLVNFFATWCPPCIQEMPGLVSLHRKYSDKGFSVLGLSVDQGGREGVQRFLRQHGVNFPVLMTQPELGRGFGGVLGVPTSFLVDRQGRIVKRYEGFVEPAAVEGLLPALLREKAGERR